MTTHVRSYTNADKILEQEPILS